MATQKKTIVITGANRGIGLAAGKMLLQSGHRVIFTARDPEKLAAAVGGLSGEKVSQVLDVTRPESVDAFAGWVRSYLGGIDVLVNNAGSVFDHAGSSGAANGQRPPLTSLAMLRKTFDLNVFGAYHLTQAMIPFLPAKGRADIINVSSGMGALTDMGTGSPAYRMSKAALNALTRNLAAEYSSTNIHVNSVCPGWCKTDLGGPGAPRSPEQGAHGIIWLIESEPDLNGDFIRDEKIIAM